MQIKLALVFIFLLYCFCSCSNSASGPAVFCDTTCNNDSLKFVNTTNKFQPYVYISMKDCLPDTITWSYAGLGVNRNLAFTDMVSSTVYINRKFIRCIISDTSTAWLLFNNCINGRGYFMKFPFDKKKSISMRGSAINNFDQKFFVEDELMAYTDKGNIFVEDMVTGKKAMMTFGRSTDMDYDAIHEVLDSVNITKNRIWAKVKFDKKWETLEKNITLE